MSDVVVDRSRITHREGKRMALMSMEMQKAQQNLDVDTAAVLLNETDAYLAKIVVSVPEDWLPAGVNVGAEGWLDSLSQKHYEELLTVLNGETTDSKKA